MKTLYLILYILAAVSFLAAAFWDGNRGNAASSRLPGYVNLVALGLLFWVLVPLIALAKSL